MKVAHQRRQHELDAGERLREAQERSGVVIVGEDVVDVGERVR
jgi:hypothetical protein